MLYSPNINDDGLLVVEDVFHSYGVSYGARGFLIHQNIHLSIFVRKLSMILIIDFKTKKFNFSLNKYIHSVEIFESIVAFKINESLCKIENEVLYNKGKNFELKDYAHIHDPNTPGSNKFVVFIKNLYPKFRGTLKYFVFKINERFLKKFFK